MSYDAKKSKNIYKRLKRTLEKKLKGQVVAIESKTGSFIVGKDELEAAIRAHELWPGKLFDFFKIGSAAVHKFRCKK